MWNCAKQCGYWDGSGCGINYTPDAFLLLCPCFELAVTHARDPTPADVVTPEGQRLGLTSSVNDQSQRAAQLPAVKDRYQVPENGNLHRDAQRGSAAITSENFPISGKGTVKS